jgi:hypothetical protein
MEQSAGVGQFWTPIMAVGGSLLHADQHRYEDKTLIPNIMALIEGA